jgi:PAS domain-containing protein
VAGLVENSRVAAGHRSSYRGRNPSPGGLGSLASGKAFELVEAASAIGLLMFPAMLYAIARLGKAQKEMHDLVSEEQQSSHATRVLLDTTTEGIYGIDADGKCTMANRAAGELLGYGPKELIGRDMHDLHPSFESKRFSLSLRVVSRQVVETDLSPSCS